MRFSLPVILGLAAWLCINPTAGTAQDKKPAGNGVTSTRPFLPGLSEWQEGERIAKAVRDGDEEAVEEFRAAGLSYVPQLSRISWYHPEVSAAYRKFQDWVEAMQQWEATLTCSEPGAYKAFWTMYSKRFVDAEAQLARAALFAHCDGESADRDELFAKAPDSAWVKAARAWAGLAPDAQTAVRDLIGILPQAVEMDRRLLSVFKRHFADPEPDDAPNSWPSRRRDFADQVSAAGIRELRMYPEHLRPSLVYERIGTLAADTGDPKFIDAAEQSLKTCCDEHKLGDAGGQIFRLVARPDASELRAPGARAYDWLPDMCGGSAIGYMNLLPEESWLERALAASAGWAGMPESILCRRLMLSRTMVIGDAMLTSLAARAALAHGDGDIGTWRDVGRALMRFSSDKDLARKFAAALRATKHAQLVPVADIMDKGDPAPLDALQRGKIELDLGHRVAVLNTFASDAERAASGGPAAVYWLNRAAFLEGLRDIRGAVDALWEAMAAGGVEARPARMSTAALAWLRFVDRNLPNHVAEQHVSRQARKHAKLAEVVTALASGEGKPDSDLAIKAWRIGGGQHVSLKPLPEDVAIELSSHPESWGGSGLMLAAEDALRGGRYAERRKLVQAAIETSPADVLVHTVLGPDGENVATYRGGNWELAARHAIAHALLQPFSMDTILFTTHSLIRSGQFPFSIGARGAGSLLRRSHCFPFTSWPHMYNALSYGRRTNTRVLHRMMLMRPEPLHANSRRIMTAAVFELATGERALDFLGNAGALSLPGGRYPMQLMGTDTRYLNMRDVNHLLNYSYTCPLFWPEQTINYVKTAEEIGVSRYGGFVGTQGLVEAHAMQGKLADILARYHDFRAGQVGNPPVLDTCLLSGLARGNNHKEAAAAKSAIDKYEMNDRPYTMFNWRRLLLALELHDEIASHSIEKNMPVWLEDGIEYAGLFHEAAALLQAGKGAELIQRASPYTEFKVEAGMGVYADAAILRAIAMKILKQPVTQEKNKKRLVVIDETLADALIGGSRTMETILLDMLCGRSEAGPLPEQSVNCQWHGAMFAERPSSHHGSGLMTAGECAARDPFVRGVLAWLQDDNAKAREWLTRCVNADQRFSHEYHVAKWLLGGVLKAAEADKKADGEKKAEQPEKDQPKEEKEK